MRRSMGTVVVGSEAQGISRAEPLVGLSPFRLRRFDVAPDHLRRAPTHEDSQVFCLATLSQVLNTRCTSKGMSPFEVDASRVKRSLETQLQGVCRNPSSVQ